MGQDTLDFGTSFSSVSRRKVCQAGVSFPFEPTEGGQSSVRYAHFVLASFQKILNSFNPVLPRILIFLRGVRCLFRFPVRTQKMCLNLLSFEEYTKEGVPVKAARLYEYEKDLNVELRVEDTREPTIDAPDEVVVRVGAAGLCRTDLHIVEGVWRDVMDPEGTLLPYVMGHENAGWIEAVGGGVKSVKPGDAVICHPLRSCGICRGCRGGEDMYCEDGQFPGLSTDGGFAEYLLTNERTLIKLKEDVLPVAVAPLADAGITAYRVAKRAAQLLDPGSYCVVLGVGGLGHIALQCLHTLCATRTVAIDKSEAARNLAQQLGAYQVLDSNPDVVEEVKELTQGGAHAVIDFVGERGAEQICWQMLRKGGAHFIVGYGGRIEVPTLHMISNEIAITGSLVGNYMELVELMELNAEGRVKLQAQQYALENINAAITDFKNGQIVGRGVIVP